MSNEKSNPSTPVVVTQAALRRIERELKIRFRAYFQPGERARLSVEDEKDYVYARLSLALPGGRDRLDLEAAMIAQDQDRRFVEATTSRMRLLGAIEFLSQQLEAYFRSQRQLRFHVDWRLYPVEEATVRFRGRHRQPGLEREASKLLGEDEELL